MYKRAVARGKAFLQRRFFAACIVSPVAWRSDGADVSNDGGGGPATQSPKRAALWRTLVPEDIERGG